MKTLFKRLMLVLFGVVLVGTMYGAWDKFSPYNQVFKGLLINASGDNNSSKYFEVSGNIITAYSPMYDGSGARFITGESDPIFILLSGNFYKATNPSGYTTLEYITGNYYDMGSIDNQLGAFAGGLIYRGIWDMTDGDYPSPMNTGDFYKISGAGTGDGQYFATGDNMIANSKHSSTQNELYRDRIVNVQNPEYDPIFTANSGVYFNLFSGTYFNINSGTYYNLNPAGYITGEALSGYLTGTDWTKSGAIIYNNNTGNVIIGSGVTLGNGTTRASVEARQRPAKYSIFGGSDSQGSGTITNLTNKSFRVVMPSYYSDSELGVGVIAGGSIASSTILNFGGGIIGAIAANTVNFYTSPTVTGSIGTTRMTINSTGNVGIGTTLPTVPLDVNGIINIGTSYYYSIGGSSSLSATTSELKLGSTVIQKDLGFYNGVSSPAMFLTSGGKLGVGTTTPIERFVVVDNTADGDVSRFQQLSVSGYSDNVFVNNLGSFKFAIGYANTGTNALSGYSFIQTFGNAPLAIGNQNIADLVISGHKFGFNTLASGDLVTVNGSIRIISGTIYAPDGYPYITGASISGIDLTAYMKLSGDQIITGNNQFYGYNRFYTGISIAGNDLLGTDLLISSKKGTNSSGYNVFIGGGGALITGVVGDLSKGSYNTAIGFSSLLNITNGHTNVAVGYQSLRGNNVGWSNSAVGYQSLYTNTQGYNNVANGYQSLYSNLAGADNVAIGANAARTNVGGIQNVAIGSSALRSIGNNNYNTAIGYYSQYSTVANGNSSLGVNTMRGNVGGSYNTAMGYEALRFSTTAGYNTVYGYHALYSNVTGSNNVALGSSAGKFLSDGVTPLKNTQNSLFLGYDTRSSETGTTNENVIGYGAIGNGSDSMTLGGSGILKTIIAGNVGIGTNTPGYKLDVAGTGRFDELCLGVSCITARPSAPASIWTTGATNFAYYTGNIAIGTNTGSETLTVSGTMFITSWVYLSTGSRIGMSGSNMSFQMYTGGNRIEKMWITP